MKVRIAIPIDLRLQSGSVFRVTKQEPASEGRMAWEMLYETTGVSGGEYLADLEPGHYQTTLTSMSGQLSSSGLFQITEDGKYLDETGKVFIIAEDGKLIDQSDQQESA